jgi:rare lipoprotein A
LKNWPEHSTGIVCALPALPRKTPAWYLLQRSFLLFLLAALAAAGCAQRPAVISPVPPAPTPASGGPPAESSLGFPSPPVRPPAYIEQGVASWYGIPFHGRKASSGEVFDMDQIVAAHRTLPFNSIVRVTNLSNGMQIDVRIIDRGPFVAGRVIDLSRAAARAIDMERAGVAPVRLELVASPATFVANYTVQIAAFTESQKAEELRAELAPRYPVYVQEFDTEGGHFYRVRVGRLANQREAQQLADLLATEGYSQPLVVRFDGLQ